MLTLCDRIMQGAVILFAILVIFAWNGWCRDVIKYAFYLPILGSLIYSFQVIKEEKELKGRFLGNLFGIAITITSLAFAMKFIQP
ncbi:hypothetical protein SB394_31635 [Burkholderia sp. BCCIQ04A]|uniref:Uncharacterized protein n=1 Tax=Burkholderia anthinoferrum TaxID=3090833 RepID=A0ABU5WR99_9BURK|nr:hypothetical protein [Burkholderia anthinoferrum]MEB2504763.1 hypothetical protein [Burkholderia anthinoferrum]MEB2534886.1 hypothetical protein [Burkholderia anthinoferrum]MEB2560540.1 hypothetical protein [Burkholderia anthinoferrum]MEB2581468.1 hypothetical protein [Burkholderia anthinoferrum]MEB2638269.1 hypothetical protein [Burkholderia anthinoferrum]